MLKRPSYVESWGIIDDKDGPLDMGEWIDPGWLTHPAFYITHKTIPALWFWQDA